MKDIFRKIRCTKEMKINSVTSTLHKESKSLKFVRLVLNNGTASIVHYTLEYDATERISC